MGAGDRETRLCSRPERESTAMVANDVNEAVYGNHILAALPIAEIQLLRPHLSRMTMVSSQVLHKENSPITDVFFIENGVISLTADTHDLGRVESWPARTRGICGCLSDPQPRAVVCASRIHPGSRRRVSNECYSNALCRRAIRKAFEICVCAMSRC
jgi:hypothetical protein